MSELPPGWQWTTIGHLTLPVSKVDPRSEPDREFDYIDIGGVDGDDGEILETQRLAGRDAPSRARQLVRVGDTVLSTVRTYMRKTASVPSRLDGQVASTGFSVLRPAEGVNPMYLYHSVRRQEFVATLSSLQTGSSYPAVRDKDVRSMPIPLAPEAEQERIVAAIEEHLSRLDAAEESLVSAGARLRQMVSKVKEAIVTHAPLVPLADLAVESRYGTSVKCDYHFSGPGVVRIPNVLDESILVSDLKYATDPAGVSSEVILREGDVVFVRTNGSRDLIGRAAVVSGDAVGLGFASYLIRYRLRTDVDPRYLCAVVSAPSIRRVLEGMAATTAGQYNLSVSKLDSVLVPLPSLDEQRQLVRARSQGLAAVEHLTNHLGATERRARCLRRSILAAAFSGQLVPQDPDDEPASVLLERIRAERAVAAPTKRTRKVKAS